MTERFSINEKWIKASILGTLWAASEIVLGSFLHNLRIPFSSTVLSSIGLIILISSGYKWREMGIYWRAGLICALMKTMSPSAVIFGPMVAIFAQSLLLELSVRIFRRTIPGYVIGAMLATSWNLFQKIFNYILYYGFSIVEVYTDLLAYAQQQFNIRFDVTWLPVLVLLGIYSTFGLIAAIIGMRVGHRLLQQPMKTNDLVSNDFKPLNFKQSGTFNYSLVWLFLNLLFIVTAMILLNRTGILVWASAIFVLVSVWALRYKRALRHLMKPRFWLYFVIITMTVAFVVNRVQSQSIIHGIIAGLQMNFRAAVIILGFSVLGTELYNPRIRDFFMKTGFRQLPVAMKLSVESLPLTIAGIPKPGVILKNPAEFIYRLISQTESRLEEMKARLTPKVFIVSGTIGQGKTTWLMNLAVSFKARNISVGGILSPRVMENGTTLGYDIENIATGNREAFLRKDNSRECDRIGSYCILPGGLKAGMAALDDSKRIAHQNIIIDEVGRLELENEGWAQSISELLQNNGCNLILSVRDTFTDEIIKKWDIQNPVVIDVSKTDSQALFDSFINS
ncbi:MAG: hypothetical protein EA393_10895 [Bacteroidetes bacterium]|nr:MAG: hypothetical protein EA393_10895 [Bacteroidota bacterium]